MERDAIVQSLLDHEGNKVKAAKSLGMSRATIFRKIHEYRIVVPPLAEHGGPSRPRVSSRGRQRVIVAQTVTASV